MTTDREVQDMMITPELVHALIQERLLEAARIQRENEARALSPRGGHSRLKVPRVRSWRHQLFSRQRADGAMRASSHT